MEGCKKNLCCDLCGVEMRTHSGAEWDPSAALHHRQVAAPIPIWLAFPCDSMSVDTHGVS